MNGIDDLRSTLDRHADDAVDVGTLTRRTGVHHRIAAARRRRRAAGAAGVAAVVAVVGGVALLPSGEDGVGPAGPAVFGRDLPAEMTSLGFTYAYDQHVSGDGRVVLDLPASDEPRLVSWGTDGDDDLVTLTASSPSALLVEAADFSDFTYVPEGGATRVVARVGEGRVALASYALTDARPDGVTQDGITYRSERAGGELLGAVIGEPGEAEVTVPATATSRGVTTTYLCSGGPEGAWVHVATQAGEVLFGAGCDDAPVVDAAGRTAYSSPTRPGADETARLYVTDGRRGPLVEDPDLRLSIGVYADVERRDVGTLGGLAEVVERDGHLWRLARVVRATTDGDRAVAPVPDLAGPLLVSVTSSGLASTLLSLEIDGVDVGGALSTGRASFTAAVPVGAEGAALVAERGDLPAEAEAVAGYYVRAD